MPKTKKDAEVGHGDWSATGTFLRKPTSGWLHEERELTRGAAINYSVQYLGCVEVNQSMRALQYAVRTQVTKEAILRLAEASGRLQPNKKRKVPKQINRVLGANDTRWAGLVNLAICVDSLKISNTAGREIMNHSLPSISFASGGEGPTTDFIGYVAKDPIHERACHVFECSGSSQYVLATIGQAFELRYKLYLNSPRPQPIQIVEGIDGDAWGSSHIYEEGGSDDRRNAPLPTPPPDPSMTSGGIYSDLPEFPPSESPPPLQPANSRPRVYSNLPGFPVQEQVEPSYGNGPALPRLENPYDTISTTRPEMQFSEDGTYSNPGEITTSGEEGVYDNRMMTIRQTSAQDSSNLIDITPSPQKSTPAHHDYGNVGIGSPNGAMGNDSLYDNKVVEEVRGREHTTGNVYDDPHALAKPAVLSSTPAGIYDNPSEVQFGQERPEEGGLNLYDNQAAVAREIREQEEKEAPLTSPRFDDTIYMRRSNDNANGNVKKDPLENMALLRQSLPSQHTALRTQPYFHGAVSRVEAEALLEGDGQFLIRESTKRPGQYVLTGMANGTPQHLLLMDKHGKVKSRDHEFESIPHLVHYFMEHQLPLVIGNSTVHLYKPVVNAFPSS